MMVRGDRVLIISSQRKRKEREEEERFERRLQEQQEKMAREFEEEQNKKKEKENAVSVCVVRLESARHFLFRNGRNRSRLPGGRRRSRGRWTRGRSRRSRGRTRREGASAVTATERSRHLLLLLSIRGPPHLRYPRCEAGGRRLTRLGRWEGPGLPVPGWWTLSRA